MEKLTKKVLVNPFSLVKYEHTFVKSLCPNGEINREGFSEPILPGTTCDFCQ